MSEFPGPCSRLGLQGPPHPGVPAAHLLAKPSLCRHHRHHHCRLTQQRGSAAYDAQCLISSYAEQFYFSVPRLPSIAPSLPLRSSRYFDQIPRAERHPLPDSPFYLQTLQSASNLQISLSSLRKSQVPAGDLPTHTVLR